MSYLILPILLEGGMFLTARQQHRSVCNFHNSAKVCVWWSGVEWSLVQCSGVEWSGVESSAVQ